MRRILHFVNANLQKPVFVNRSVDLFLEFELRTFVGLPWELKSRFVHFSYISQFPYTSKPGYSRIGVRGRAPSGCVRPREPLRAAGLSSCFGPWVREERPFGLRMQITFECGFHFPKHLIFQW